MRRSPLLTTLAFLAFILFGCNTQKPAPIAATPTPTTPPALIPMPVKYDPAPGTVPIDHAVILADPAAQPIAQYLSNLLAPSLGAQLPILSTAGPQGVIAKSFIEIHIHPDDNIPPEGYTLDAKDNLITITASTPAGAFYATQTLRQLLPPETESPTKIENPHFAIPCCHIEDYPRYPWRGALLDSCRHFFPKETVKRFIDLLALHKMNTLQWHLTDDQGWRIEIKKYPKLTEIGAGASEDIPLTTTQPAIPGPKYGGFYSQSDIREIVAYAQSRFVTIVPEIEMPGHATAALAAYPELACTPGPFTVGNRRGVYKDIYCAGNEQTFTFLENVLDEVCDLFPGTYIHVGGDEAPKDRWKTCPLCQQRMKDNNLKDENELQSYFIKRIEAYLETKHRRLIGWDEILEGGLPPGASVTSWRGTSGGKTAAIAGHDVVMCPESNCYLDHMADLPDLPYHSATVTLPRVYAFEPTPSDLTPDQQKHILGAQGNLWSEFIPDQNRLDFMAFPRLCALAEVLWSPFHDDFADFSARLTTHFKQLDALQVNYYHDPLAQAALIANWSPSDNLTQTGADLNRNITPFLKAPGTYEVRLEFLDGKSRVDIDSITLLENNDPIATDTHPGFAGIKTSANKYHLTLPQITPNATYTLRVHLHAPTPETHGQLFLLPIPTTSP